jgi:hypothetical protein
MATGIDYSKMHRIKEPLGILIDLEKENLFQGGQTFGFPYP